ncbi:MAG: DUF3179 domain-containing protein [Gemmatimonadales bacterium]
MIRINSLAAIGTTVAWALVQIPVVEGQWQTDFDRHTVPLEEITSGGPPKDGIPPIDHPRFVSVTEADRWLKDREPVVTLSIGGQTKAYPIQILMWHEIVNDEVGGTPVSVTFCPLCNTALTFDRRFDGQVLDFGTTGMLRHSDLVMYDRQTESWWQQATGEGIVGTYAGRQLKFLSSPLVNWAQFKEEYPDGTVLSRATGFSRDYGRNPYVHYDTRSGPYGRFFKGAKDRRLTAMDRVVAIMQEDSSVAYPTSALAERAVINDEFVGRPIVVFWAPGTASALDDASIADGRDVGATGVFQRRVKDRILEFEPAGVGVFRDRQTGSTWNIMGRAVTGPLAGVRLEAVQHGNHFWFAWAVFRPDTRLGGVD